MSYFREQVSKRLLFPIELYLPDVFTFLTANYISIRNLFLTAFYFSDGKGKLSQAQNKIFRRSFIGETKGKHGAVF